MRLLQTKQINLCTEGTKQTILCDLLFTFTKLPVTNFAIRPSRKHTNTMKILPALTPIFQIATICSNYITQHAFPLIFSELIIAESSAKYNIFLITIS